MKVGLVMRPMTRPKVHSLDLISYILIKLDRISY